MCIVSTSIICSVKKIEEGAYFHFSYKKAVIMAKGDRKRAKSGSFFQISNKISPKGKNLNTNLWQAPVLHQTDYSPREVTLLIVETSQSDCGRGLGQQKMDWYLEIGLLILRKWSGS